jgi:HEPN domain-containing protein/predicted nucleotidyltransferase
MSDRTTLLSPLVEEIARRIPEAPSEARPGRAQLAAVVASIAERFRPERIVLFGSRAYGTPTFDSDVDLMVVMETDLPNPEQAFRINSTLDLVPSFALDILARRPEQIALGLAEGDFFIHDVMRKGIALYDSGRRSWEMSAPSTPPPAGAGGGVTQATQGWLDKGDGDLAAARVLAAQAVSMYDQSSFFAQQAAEKILKGFLQQHLVPFPRIHNLDDLANLALPVLPGVQSHLVDLQWLTRFFVDIRYPGATATAADIARAIQIAADVRTLVRTALGLPTT